MGISQKDETLLMWFFERGVAAFWRSTQGAMLERAHNRAFDSEGMRVPSSSAWSAAASLRVREHREEASYLPDEEDLLRVARVSRRLRAVCSADPAAEQALAIYYGPEGARSARSDHGRIFSLYPVTDAGQAFLRADLEKHPDREDGATERLLAEHQVQAVEPTEKRRTLLALMHAQAETRLRRAWAAWAATEERRAEARAS
jgi:hypothetical protein